jgi:hypothetical protein
MNDELSCYAFNLYIYLMTENPSTVNSQQFQPGEFTFLEFPNL